MVSEQTVSGSDNDDDVDLTDPDNPEWTEEDFARATRVEDLPPDELAIILRAFPKTKAYLTRIGRPPQAETKVAVSLRLDRDIVDYFRASGRGWQSRMNAVLRASIPQR